MRHNGDVFSGQVAPLLEAVVRNHLADIAIIINHHTDPITASIFVVGSKAWFLGALGIQAPVGAISDVDVPLCCYSLCQVLYRLFAK